MLLIICFGKRQGIYDSDLCLDLPRNNMLARIDAFPFIVCQKLTRWCASCCPCIARRPHATYYLFWQALGHQRLDLVLGFASKQRACANRRVALHRLPKINLVVCFLSPLPRSTRPCHLLFVLASIGTSETRPRAWICLETTCLHESTRRPLSFAKY
jgi:hypothetical protein